MAKPKEKRSVRIGTYIEPGIKKQFSDKLKECEPGVTESSWVYRKIVEWLRENK